jgi:[glutamine synthetase] adenylyltransferase / [glutamine synthetase]-adenylyl-L-tyrosine phosphorylase
MKIPAVSSAVKSSADPERAGKFFDLLAATSIGPRLKNFTAEQLRILAALCSGSQALGDLLLEHLEWLPQLDFERLKFPRQARDFQQEIKSWLEPRLRTGDYAGALVELRGFKQREMLRIAARDLARLSNVVEITREMSDVADVCLEVVWRVISQQFTRRLGRPFHQDANGCWQPTTFCVLGLGKLGGQELNYSSDVDVLFVYSDEGEVFKELPAKKKTPHAVMPSHQFFRKLAETFIAEVSRTTEEGSLFRIDLRLRPEGDAGPLCRSLESYENYYSQWGQTWERMMLIKTRHVAGDGGLAAEFIEMIQLFRFPRSVSRNILQEVAAVKDRIEKEVLSAEELKRNVKLGRGGIREVEFIVQSLQVLHGGRLPFLQVLQTLQCLEKLERYSLLLKEEVLQLGAAYRFLRDVEHRLQMENNLQTHTIPNDPSAQLRLARLMDFKSLKQFETALQTHTGNVRQIYDKQLKNESLQSRGIFPEEFDASREKWEELLAAHSFRDSATAFHLLKEFVEGPGDVHVSPRTVELTHQLIPKLFALCLKQKSEVRSRKSEVERANSNLRPPASGFRLSDPDRVLTRLVSFISVYGARVPLLEMWNGNPAMFELMLLLFDRSEFLAEVAIHTPDLIDDLVTTGRLRQRKTTAEILEDLRYGSQDADQYLWLRRYHETELMRLGLRDILGLVDFEQNLAELSALADACLQYALEVVMRKNKIKKPPFIIIGFGKLGGCEIDYGSDLDVVFVADLKVKDLPKLQRLAMEVMELMSHRTEQGIVFHVDARLRPDGEKGLLVNTLHAYGEYYRRRAQLWEIQALTRTRPVAGDPALGEKFQKLAALLTDFSKPSRPLAAFKPDWKGQIHQMRMRIEKERTPAGKDDLAIKTGKGGLMDAEFIAQTLCLEHGWQEANTLRVLDRGRDAGVLPNADKLIKNYRQLRRVEGILRRWSYEGETVLPDEPEPYCRVSVRCGFSTPQEFKKALAKWRGEIRKSYVKVFPF